MLKKEERNALLHIVCESLHAAVTGGAYTVTDPGYPALQKAGGCFVTYKTHGQLRGCIGCFERAGPLYRTVARFAHASAREDPRFLDRPLAHADLPDVVIDISVLSSLERTTEPETITLGVHGIHVRRGMQSGCFLPQVASETGWTVEEFWGMCCRHKAGLPAEAWRDAATECSVFTAEVVEGHYRDPASWADGT